MRSAWDQVADVVTPEDFYRPDHRLIFEALAALAGDRPARRRRHRLRAARAHGQLEDAGGLAYLGTLARDTPTAANVRAYADIVRERSLLRQLIEAGTRDRRRRSSATRARRRASWSIAPSSACSRSPSRARAAATGARARAARCCRRSSTRSTSGTAIPNKLRGLATGFTDFDKHDRRPAPRRSGHRRRPALDGQDHARGQHGRVRRRQSRTSRASVAIFSMEMPSEQVVTRMLSSIGDVPLNSMRSGQHLRRRLGAHHRAPPASCPRRRSSSTRPPALTPTELRARARRIKREHGLGLVVVDYLQLMQVPGTKENRATEIAEISRGLKALAKELQVPVIALSQLNRARRAARAQEAGDVGSARESARSSRTPT